MEIRVETKLKGWQLRDRILRKYGSRERLEQAARRPGATEENDDLVTLKEFENNPRRLDMGMRIETVARLSPKDLERLTTERLRLLEYLAKRRRPPNVTKLAEALGRDKTNVSEDLQTLARLGLVFMRREGRQAFPEPLGTAIHITFANGVAGS